MKEKQILINHWRWPDYIDQQTNFDYLRARKECFCFCLNVSGGFQIGILQPYPG